MIHSLYENLLEPNLWLIPTFWGDPVPNLEWIDNLYDTYITESEQLAIRNIWLQFCGDQNVPYYQVWLYYENRFGVRPFSKTFSTDYIVVPERRRRTRFIWIQFALSIFMMLVCGTHICGVVQSGEVGRKSYGVFQQILFSKF